VYCML